MQVSYFKHAKRHSFHVMFFEDQYVPVQRNIYIIMILYILLAQMSEVGAFHSNQMGMGQVKIGDPKN